MLFAIFFPGEKWPTFKIFQSVFNHTDCVFYKESDHIQFLEREMGLWR